MALIVLALLLLGLPGYLLAARLFPDEPPAHRAIWGGALGLAGAVYVAYVCGAVALHWFWPVWGLLTALVVGCHYISASRAPLVARPGAASIWLVLLIALSTALRVGLTWGHTLPAGWDPSFHCLLANKIYLTDHLIADWRPFEDIRLNYPIGSHALLAVLARITGLPVHRVFQPLAISVAALGVAQVYLLALRLRLPSPAAVAASAVYALLCPSSVDGHAWGGLPNFLAMSFFLPVMTILADDAPRPRPRHLALGAFFLAAVIITHHHVMLTAGVLLLALLAYYSAFDRAAHRVQTILLVGIGGVLLSAFYTIPFALRVVTIRNTSSLSSGDIDIGWGALGWPFTAAVILGLALFCLRPERSRKDVLLYLSSAVLIVLTFLLSYAAPKLAQLLGFRPVRPFTPSRFLTDVAYFLSIFAGYGAWRLVRLLRLPAYSAVPLIVALSVTNLSVWRELRHANDILEYVVSPPQAAAFDWIRQHTREDVLVLVRDWWAPYLTQRACVRTPVPVSEPHTAGTARQKLASDVWNGRVTAGVCPPLLAVRPAVQLPPGGRVLWQHPSGLVVVQVPPPGGYPGGAAPDALRFNGARTIPATQAAP